MMQQTLGHEPVDASGAVVGVISNPGSTRNKQIMPQLRALAAHDPFVLHNELDSVAAIPNVLKMFADAQIAVLVINGGDGTIQATLSSLVNDKPFDVVPPIAILPGGKTNMIAADLGATGSPLDVLNELVELVKADKVDQHVVQRHLIEMDLGDGNRSRVGMFFGTAGIVRGMLWCRSKIYPLNMPNFLSHLISILALILSSLGIISYSPLRSGPLGIHLPSETKAGSRYSIVLVTTLDRLLLRLRPFSKKGDGGLRFTAIKLGARPMLAGLRALFSRNFGDGKEEKGILSTRTDEIVFDGKDPVTLDGEIYFPKSGTPIVLRGDKHLNFVRF